jgi:hypothetical protein
MDRSLVCVGIEKIDHTHWIVPCHLSINATVGLQELKQWRKEKLGRCQRTGLHLLCRRTFIAIGTFTVKSYSLGLYVTNSDSQHSQAHYSKNHEPFTRLNLTDSRRTTSSHVDTLDQTLWTTETTFSKTLQYLRILAALARPFSSATNSTGRRPVIHFWAWLWLDLP